MSFADDGIRRARARQHARLERLVEGLDERGRPVTVLRLSPRHGNTRAAAFLLAAAALATPRRR